jgi:hypothetical protein
VNLRKRLGLEKRENDKDTRIVVVEIEGKTIGFIVDSVSEVLRVPKSVVEPPPELISGIDSEYIIGIAKLENRLLILLDLKKVLNVEERETLKKFSAIAMKIEITPDKLKAYLIIESKEELEGKCVDDIVNFAKSSGVAYGIKMVEIEKLIENPSEGKF